MKERPIIFNAEMVRAVLDGRKTQTRRPVKAQPKQQPDGFWLWADKKLDAGYCHTRMEPMIHLMRHYSPFGSVGDRLWVRETFFVDTSKLKPDQSDKDFIYYRSDGECCQQIPECACGEIGKPKWKPSIHMPRWASRILLEITNIRVQRVQDISEPDAECEGVETATPQEATGARYKPAFRCLWDDIYDNWDANPWVWVVEFKRIEPEQ